MSKPRRAAGVIAVRPVPNGLQVYLVQRGSKGRFFPGFHAFPGGALDPQDDTCEDPFRMAAARELWEETGLWVGPRQPDSQQRQSSWSDLLQKYPLALEQLLPAGIRTTPEYALIRFRAQFFLWLCPPEQQAEFCQEELEEGSWWLLQEAIEAWQSGRLFWAAPTQDSLLELARHPGDLLAAGRALSNYPEDTPDPIRVLPGLSYVPLETETLPPARHTLCFLIGHERVLIVDPGSPDPEQLARLSAVLQGRSVEAVLFTHHHGDHVGGLEWCRQQGWPLWGSQSTGQSLGVAWDRHLNDGDRVQDWQVLHTPGHAAGHLALWHSATGILLSGDLVSGVSTILVPDEAGAMQAYLASLERCIALAPRLVMPSHGGPFGPSSGLLERTLAHRLQREAKVCRTLAAGPIAFESLLARVYEDVQGVALELARISLASHLRKLQEEGRALQVNHQWCAQSQSTCRPDAC